MAALCQSWDEKTASYLAEKVSATDGFFKQVHDLTFLLNVSAGGDNRARLWTPGEESIRKVLAEFGPDLIDFDMHFDRRQVSHTPRVTISQQSHVVQLVKSQCKDAEACMIEFVCRFSSKSVFTSLPSQTQEWQRNSYWWSTKH